MKFKLNPDADLNNTHRVGSVSVAPARLIEVFGQPELFDEYKVSGEYSFDADDGTVFSVYDYKETSLYAPGRPSPETFWGSRGPRHFSVGGRDESDVEGFCEWLYEALET